VSEKKAKSVRLPDELLARLEAVARASGKTISEVIRDAVGEYIAEIRRDQEFKERLNKRLEEDREILERLAG
jgi:metal-responsive CopG/Arc/MetJ family transcriptional regulator